jgi:hypothetical protein
MQESVLERADARPSKRRVGVMRTAIPDATFSEEKAHIAEFQCRTVTLVLL